MHAQARLCLGVLCVAACLSGGRADPLAALADPRPGGHWVVDSAAALGARAAACDGVGATVQASGQGQVVAVVVATSGGTNLRTAGTSLHNRWRLGRPGHSDGVLVVLALQDRQCEIILGDDVDDNARVAASQRIFDEVMKPHLRAGQTGEAVLAGMQACASRILGVAPKTAVPGAPSPRAAVPAATPMPTPAPTTAVEAEAPSGVAAPVPALPPPSTGPLTGFTPVPSSGHVMSRPGMFVMVPVLLLLFVLAGLAVGGVAILFVLVRRPPACPQCRQPLLKLDEAADDAHLTESERLEERLGSVNYDIWVCPGCAHAEKRRRGAWFTRYSRCPQCNAITRLTHENVVVSPTEHSEGLAQVKETCANCTWSRDTMRPLPRRPHHHQAGAMGAGLGMSSGSRHTSSFGSRHSSGGHSGGGHSSGRGGGGRW